MPQLLVRDVSPEIVDAIKRRAAANGRSAEAEHRAILEESLQAERNAFREVAKRLREQTAGRNLSDSTDLIREDRDSR
jgi:plasmid stability protein